MSGRSVGLTETLHSLVPPVVVSVFILITQLGSLPILLAGSACIFWFFARREGLILVGATLAAGALTSTLKAMFALPRPPSSTHFIIESGFGFPSGHAIAGTIFWALAAIILPVGTKRTRIVVASSVIVLVGLSRVILGVHYLIDVVAGIIVGLGYLYVLTGWDPVTPYRSLAFAALLGGLAIILARDGDAFALFGAAISGFAIWRLTPSTHRTLTRRDLGPFVLGAGVLGLIGGTYLLWPSRPLALGVGISLGAGIIGLPSLTERIRTE